MAIPLRQSTSSQEIPLGYFVDSADGNTEETALTIANTDIKLWKAGATTLANKNNGGATHISNGIYYAVLDATDSDTLGSLVVFVHVAGALAVRVECLVLAANVYDSLVAGSDALQVHANEITAGLITAAAIATGAVDADALAADAVMEIADGVWDEALSGHAGVGSAGEALSNAGSGASAADIADAVWDEAQADHTGAGSTGASLNNAGSGASAADIADAVLDEALADHVGPGSLGKGVSDILADTGTDGVVVAAASKTGYALTAAEHTNIADALLKRDWTLVTGEAARSVLNALRFLRNKVSIASSTMTVTKEDDSTEAWTATVTTDSAADPVTAVDPT
jgi:hypothetical protein